MFDIGWGELVVIGVVALVAIGPKELPGVLRTVGQMMTKVRRMASEFQGQFQEAMREAELSDIKKQAEQLTDFSKVNPLEDTKREIEKTFDEKAAEPVKTESAASLPEVKIDVPLPEPLPPVSAADFAPPANDTAPVEPAPAAQSKTAT